MTTAAQTQALAKKLMQQGAFTPASAGGDFYQSVAPGGAIQAPSMQAFNQMPGMDAQGGMAAAMPIDASSILSQAPGQMQAGGMAGGTQGIPGQASMAPPQPVIDPNQVAPVPHPMPIKPDAPMKMIYTVRKGDTLSRIAQRYGTTVKALAAKNGIRNPNLILVGKTLKI